VKTNSSELRKPLYLNWSEIQPGDVLLTRGDGKISTAIAAASGGPYSHAALVVEPQTLFESDDVGIGYTVHAIGRVEKYGQDRILLSRLDGVRDATLLRPPGVDYPTAEQIGEKLREVLRPLVGRDYPDWRALASAAKGGQLGRAFANVVLRVLDVMDSTEVKNPGPFCSQLICGAFQEAGIECFRPPRNPATVGPNDFLASELKPVNGLVRPANESAPTDDLYLEGLRKVPLATRKQQTGAAVTGLRGIADIESAVNAIEKLRRGA
jgi:hypothetical protein